MTNKANSKLSFLRRNLKGCPEKLKQTAYFSLVRSFMEYGATVWDPYQKYNSDKVERVQHRAARFVKSRYSRQPAIMSRFLGMMTPSHSNSITVGMMIKVRDIDYVLKWIYSV